MLKFRVPVQNADTIARFCGALYNKIDLSVSSITYRRLNCSEHQLLHDPLQDADSYIKALLQALKKVEYASIK